MSLIRRIFALVAAGLALTICFPASPVKAMEEEAAQKLVLAVVDEGMKTFAGKNLSAGQRSAELARLITKYTDMSIVARAALGSNWARATDQEKASFAPLLLKYVSHTWQGALTDISPEQKLKIDSSHSSGKYVIIRSTATAPGEEPATVDWVLMTTPEGRDIVIDISVDGGSILHTIQADFGSFIRNNDGKIAALFELMNKKIAQSE